MTDLKSINSNSNITSKDVNKSFKSKKLPAFVYLCDTTQLYQVWQLIFEYPKKKSINKLSEIAKQLVIELEQKYNDYHFYVKDIVLKPYPPPFLAINRSCASYYRINIVKKNKSIPKPNPPLKLPPIKPKDNKLNPLLNLLVEHQKNNFPLINTYPQNEKKLY